jgi:hypothetical protein
MKYVVPLFLLIIFFGCSSKQEKGSITKSNVYKPSEMAVLMLKMYDKNLDNKKLILAGKTPVKFSKEFLNIHTATLTDPTDRDAAFNGYADFYLQSYKMIFKASKDSLKLMHNSTINSCIACHKTTCIGSIPRIKKLLIL